MLGALLFICAVAAVLGALALFLHTYWQNFVGVWEWLLTVVNAFSSLFPDWFFPVVMIVALVVVAGIVLKVV